MTEEQMKFVKDASIYATVSHDNVNHLYDGNSYLHHLLMVAGAVSILLEKGIIPKADAHVVLSAAYCHDLIEDCRETYNDVKAKTNERVADIVYALTNEKGKTRSERANDKYYSEMRKIKYACAVKVCDRIANLVYSLSTNSKMANVYMAENDKFLSSVNDGRKWTLAAIEELSKIVESQELHKDDF